MLAGSAGADPGPSTAIGPGTTEELESAPELHHRRACDICFRLKEKCHFRDENDQCDRCLRLKKSCSTLRSIKLGGRPRKRTIPGQLALRSAGGMGPGLPYELSIFGVLSKDLTPMEELIVRNSFQPKTSAELASIPRTAIEIMQQATYALLHHYDAVSDAFFAMCGSYSALSLDSPGFSTEMNSRRGAFALKKFCSMECPTTTQDYIPWMWVGLYVTIHTQCSRGLNAAPIRRYLLSHLARLGDKGNEFAAHPAMSSSAVIEIYDCLLRGEIPPMNVPDIIPVFPNDFLGMCVPLVRLVYELCCINNAAIQNGTNFSQLDAKTESALCELEGRVKAWEPVVAANLGRSLPAIEKTRAVLQATAHRSTVLLFIHRIRHPLGSEDTTARLLATSILSILDMARPTPALPMSWVSFPFVIAAMELVDNDDRQKAMDNVSLFVDGLTSTSREETRILLRKIWRQKDRGKSSQWRDWMKQLTELQLNYVGPSRMPQDDAIFTSRADILPTFPSTTDQSIYRIVTTGRQIKFHPPRLLQSSDAL